MQIYVDADACPVKDEIYKVARRYQLSVTLVANSGMAVPRASWLKLVLVKNRLDAADDLIAAEVTENDIVVTGDIPLASRCLEKGAAVLDHRGGQFTVENIGAVLAGREVMEQLRSAGQVTKGPRPFDQKSRSRFLQALDQVIHKEQKKQR